MANGLILKQKKRIFQFYKFIFAIAMINQNEFNFIYFFLSLFHFISHNFHSKTKFYFYSSLDLYV